MKIGEKGVIGGCLKGWPLILGVRAVEGAGVIPGEKLGFCWRTGEGKEEGDGADKRAWGRSERERETRGEGRQAERGSRGCGPSEAERVGRAGSSAWRRGWRGAGPRWCKELVGLLW